MSGTGMRICDNGACVHAYAEHGLPHPHLPLRPCIRRPHGHGDGPGQADGHDDDIENWRPLMRFDPSKLTPAQRRAILDKLYKRSFIVYDRLAEI